MNTNQEKREPERKETLLPPPELLERYEGISKGLSKELVNLVKREQEHRHRLQNAYLMHFKMGQIFGAAFLIYVIYKIFEIATVGNIAVAYAMTAMFGLLIVLILLQYKKDKLSAVMRNSGKNFNNNRRFNNGYKKSYSPQRNDNRVNQDN